MLTNQLACSNCYNTCEDDERDEWSKLALNWYSTHRCCNTECKALAISIHVALLWLSWIPSSPDKSQLLEDVAELSPEQVSLKWGNIFQEFLVPAADDNATIALHLDIMQHCDEVIGLALAERIGGPEGYQLLIAIRKESLPFSFFKWSKQLWIILCTATSSPLQCWHLSFQYERIFIFHPNRNQYSKFLLWQQAGDGPPGHHKGLPFVHHNKLCCFKDVVNWSTEWGAREIYQKRGKQISCYISVGHSLKWMQNI